MWSTMNINLPNYRLSCLTQWFVIVLYVCLYESWRKASVFSAASARKSMTNDVKLNDLITRVQSNMNQQQIPWNCC